MGEDLRRTADRLRQIPLECVLRASGARPDRYDRAKWRTEDAVLSVSGERFMDWRQGKGGGGAIDLAIHLHGLSFRGALAWLAQRVAGSGPAPVARRVAVQRLQLPPADERRLSQVIAYLVRERGLALGLVEGLLRCGKLYADSRGNAVFLLLGPDRRPVGAELRGTTGRQWRGMAPGSRKDAGCFWVGGAQPTEVVLCESAIDAMSCHLLGPHRLCLSTSGARASPGWLPAVLRRGWAVWCGFDADPVGEEMAAALIARHPAIKRLRPSLPALPSGRHDWNDVLRSHS